MCKTKSGAPTRKKFTVAKKHESVYNTAMKVVKQIDCADSGKTIRQLFAEMKLSGTTIKKFKYDGVIDVNGSVQNVNYVLRQGDVLTLVANERALHPEKAQMSAKIAYVDDFLYIADKPYNINTHPDRAHKEDTLGNRLSTSFGDEFALRIVTRLDKTTSGLVLGAFDEVTAERLNTMQLCHEIHKTYIAAVQGQTEKQGQIDLPLLRVDEQNKTICDESGKSASTAYFALKYLPSKDVTVVRLCPLTGRTHQLRAHMAAIGHPIVGDVLYGGMHSDRIYLHCMQLSFVHPVTGKNVDVTSLPTEELFNL